jgi:hypothetical protein
MANYCPFVCLFKLSCISIQIKFIDEINRLRYKTFFKTLPLPRLSFKINEKMKQNGKKTVGENEAFIRLIQIAQEDKEIREQLINILSMDSFNRKSALNTFIEHMLLKKAPKKFIEAVSSLLDEDVAKKILEILNK